MPTSSEPALSITATTEGPTTVLRLAGELDLATADVLRGRLSDVLARGTVVRQLVIDLAALEFVDVTGLGTLLDARRKLEPVGGTLTLRGTRPMVVRMLTLLGLDDVLESAG